MTMYLREMHGHAPVLEQVKKQGEEQTVAKETKQSRTTISFGLYFPVPYRFKHPLRRNAALGPTESAYRPIRRRARRWQPKVVDTCLGP